MNRLHTLTETVLYRVQAGDGRGPWRPGLSQHWVDDGCNWRLPEAVQDAFGLEVFRRIPRGWHAGCACRTLDELLKWFSPTERSRLEAMGYTPVEIQGDKIIAENADQVVFANRRPLNSNVTILHWRQAA